MVVRIFRLHPPITETFVAVSSPMFTDFSGSNFECSYFLVLCTNVFFFLCFCYLVKIESVLDLGPVVDQCSQY